jgi:N-acetylglutamate synthase-like GNAT family acetyltransferase
VNFTISDLRARPEFFDVVAARIWSAWWQPRDVPLDYIRGRLEENMNAAAIPFALVAHEGSIFIGTSSVIASDLDEVPQLTPWVAAVWVEASYRQRDVGRALVARAVDEIFALGIASAYLCALPARRDFYLRQGFVPIMEDVGERGMTVFVRNRMG